MATLKDHQNAMVDLLANGSAIPASAARLAHALHDVLGLLLERYSEPHSSFIEVTLPNGLRGQREIDVDTLCAELKGVNSQLDNALDALQQMSADNLRLYVEIDRLRGYLSRGMAGVIGYQEDKKAK